jgi:AraC-like DNA-binding protein
VPPEFIADQPAYIDIRLCPQPDCPNHQPPPGTGVRLLRDNVKSRTVGLLCTACGCQFIRRYTGELVPVAPRRSPIPPDNKRQLTKPAEEVALLLELGFQGYTNQEIAQRLGWQMATIAWYWYALDVAEAVHQAQKQRQQQKREQRLTVLWAQVEAVLAVLCRQEELISLATVSRALGLQATYLSHYDEITQHVQIVVAEHNRQCEQRRTAALRARLEAIIAGLPDQTERVTIEKMAADLGVTSAHLSRCHPELVALARTAAREQLAWLREEKRRQRCARIQEVAASLVAQGGRLTIKRVQQGAGITPCVYQADTVIRELIQQWVWDTAEADEKMRSGNS